MALCLIAGDVNFDSFARFFTIKINLCLYLYKSLYIYVYVLCVICINTKIFFFMEMLSWGSVTWRLWAYPSLLYPRLRICS